jgi:hypothetical protein
MQISALIQVINYLKDLSGDSGLIERYRKISDALKDVSAGGTETIMREKEELRTFLISTEPDSWGYSSYCLYEQINAGCLFGRAAADHLENILVPGCDFKAVNSEINSIIKQLSKFSENIKKFHQLFDLIFPAESLAKQEKEINGSSMLLYFEGNLAVHNISDLERYSRLWDNILANFCRLNGNETPAVDICNFNNGNIVLEVTTDTNSFGKLMTGVSDFLKIMPDILNIRKIQKEISLLHLQNDLGIILEEEINDIVNKKSYEVAEVLVKDSQNSVDNLKGLALSLKQILSFVEKGGKIEFRTASDNRAEVTRVLNESFLIVRELEKIAVK